MNDLQVLRETAVLDKPFKIYGDEENPVFLAKDVAEWIGHQDVSTMIRGVDEDEIILRSISGVLSAGNPNKTFLTVNGMYEVLFQSRLPLAKEFKKQVKAVLEEIRKTGVYGVPKSRPSSSDMKYMLGLVKSGVFSEKEAHDILLSPAPIPDRSSGWVQKHSVPIPPVLPLIPPLDVFLSLPDFVGWRAKLENMYGCFERFGVRLIQNRAGNQELAIDHNHKWLLKLAGREYKATLRTDPAYIETRQVYIARCQVSAMMFDWEKVRCR